VGTTSIVVSLTIYVFVVGGLMLAASITIWRASFSRPTVERWSLRGGVLASVLAVGTLGTAEAALLAFDYAAVIASILIGAISFCVGVALGGLLGALSGARA
jgi:hypothetical protein